ncbi:hypothetical protein GYY_01885 [Methanococcus maripaludis X1]|jgi:uncharacterized membrane protein|uniref:DUF2206 domain-containing protein n=1 Tax=Methanococcus maripaludis X1 TaxID=1053692 RepID=G0H2R5_METMI|nr:DUF2206 domain-containing protein [Methanococcus maripaludis]AEK19264.1 hypothetical protein GYY_01885 [Methanococcus maripaludis X1]
MKILNPFKLQNWEYKKFLMVILGIQLSLLGLFGLNKLGVETPILRAFIGFIYVSFIPGYLILRILKLNKLDSLESFLYSVGLSIFFIMLVGFLINILYPNFGITDKPISEIPVMLSISGSVIILLILSYFTNLKNTIQEYIDLNDILNPQVLLLSLVPFLAIFGSFVSNYYVTNVLLMFLYAILFLYLITIIFSKKSINYTYILFILSISLLLIVNLSGGTYIKIYDGEGIVPVNTIEKGFFEGNIKDNYYSVIGNGLYVPIIMKLLSINLITTYTYFFAFIYSLIPLLVHITIKSINMLKTEKEIFFSAFLFLSLSPFLNLLPFLKKQGLSMFFLALFFYSFFNNKLNKKTSLITIFLISIIWAHYGVASLLLAQLMLVSLILFIINNILKKKYAHNNLLKRYCVIYLLLFFSWYLYISNGSLIQSLFNIFSTVYSSIFSLNIESSRGYSTLSTFQSTLSIINKLLNIFILGLSSAGLFLAMYNFIVKKEFFNKNFLSYLIISSMYTIILILTLIPGFAVMNVSRLTAMSFLLLAPYPLYFVSIFNKFKSQIHTPLNGYTNKLICTLICINFLISSGFVGEIVNQQPMQLSISKDSLKNSEDMSDISKYYTGMTLPRDVQGTKWIAKNRISNNKINAILGHMDSVGVFQPYAGIEWYKLTKIQKDMYNDIKGYVFLYTINTAPKIGIFTDAYATQLYYYNCSELLFKLESDSKIYDNSGSQVYFT